MLCWDLVRTSRARLGLPLSRLEVVASLDEREQALLLRFVTSCQRPPPLGFEHLNPRFCLQRITIMKDDDKVGEKALAWRRRSHNGARARRAFTEADQISFARSFVSGVEAPIGFDLLQHP